MEGSLLRFTFFFFLRFSRKSVAFIASALRFFFSSARYGLEEKGDSFTPPECLFATLADEGAELTGESPAEAFLLSDVSSPPDS
jgi:hypothetical protein